MTPDEVARIIERVASPSFVTELARCHSEIRCQGFEAEVAASLRREPGLIDRWVKWSADQRWSPSAFVQGCETGWYDGGCHNVRTHADEAAAVADFIHRTSAWLDNREVRALDG